MPSIIVGRSLSDLSIQELDSLGNLYPEEKGFLLEQAVIQGVLRIDSVDRERKKILSRAFADLRLPNELESLLRRNQAVYGTLENPMKPPPAPNQVNLFDLMKAISSFLRYIGVR